MAGVKNPPEWAFRRASELISEQSGHAPCIAKDTSIGVAFARYIAEHEVAPIDPLLLEAREIVAAWWEADPVERFARSCNPTEIREGHFDETPEVTQALTALRRGIEIAQRGGDV